MLPERLLLPEGELIIAYIHGEAATYFVYGHEQRHFLIVAERYLVGSGGFQDIAFGCQNLITNSLLSFRTLG